MPSWWTAAIALPTLVSGVIGGIFGGAVQQYFAVELEQHRTLLNVRKDAYTRFFQGQAKLQDWRDRGEPEHDPEKQKSDEMIKRARFEIAVYGSKPTVDALWTYYQHPPDPTRPDDRPPLCTGLWQRWHDDAAIYQAMRGELQGWSLFSNAVDEARLVFLIHRCVMPPPPR